MFEALSRCFNTQKITHQSKGFVKYLLFKYTALYWGNFLDLQQFLSMSSFGWIDALLKVHFNFYFSVNRHFHNFSSCGKLTSITSFTILNHRKRLALEPLTSLQRFTYSNFPRKFIFPFVCWKYKIYYSG